MDRLKYCKDMELELCTWSKMLDEVTHKIDSLSCETKEKILPNIADLHILSTELKDRILTIKNECSFDWVFEKKEIDDAHVDLRSKYDEVVSEIGKASPYSVPG